MIHKADNKNENYGDIERAEILRNIGEIYLYADRLEDAESFLKKTLEIHKGQQYSNDFSFSGEPPAQFNETQSMLISNEINNEASKHMKRKYLYDLNQQLKPINKKLLGYSLYRAKLDFILIFTWLQFCFYTKVTFFSSRDVITF